MTKLLNIKPSGVTKAKTKKRFKELEKFAKQNTQEYFQNTTLHGLKYITSPNLYPLERIFFAIAFVSVVCGAAFFVLKVYDKWDTTPVILSINPDSTYIAEVPFPAVTICNLNQAYKAKAQHFSVYSTEYAMVQMLCKRDVNVTVADTITDWSNLRYFIEEISQPCENMLLNCRFGAVKYNCSELFRPIVTDAGLCCTFNMIRPEFLYKNFTGFFRNKNTFPGVDWSPERGYPSVVPENAAPFTAAGTGESLGLSITLDVEADNYYCSSSNSVGFKILLHNPMEVPNMREIGLLLSPGRESKARIQAEKIDTDSNLRSLPRETRMCVFEDEEKLKIFKRYSQRNCEIECIGRMTWIYCGCITHYMPPLYSNDTICSIYDASCVERVHIESMGTAFGGLACPDLCWPSCNDLTFLPVFSTTPLTHSGFLIKSAVVKNLSSYYVERNIAVVNIYFKENSYRSKKQSQLVDFTDFLSSIGGLIGLFFGFSFISLAEFIFYIFIRPFRTLIVYQRRQKLIHDTLENSKPNKKTSEKHSERIFTTGKQKLNIVSNASGGYDQWQAQLLEKMNESAAKSISKNVWQPGTDYTP